MAKIKAIKKNSGPVKGKQNNNKCKQYILLKVLLIKDFRGNR